MVSTPLTTFQLGWFFPTEWKNKTCSKPPTRDSVLCLKLLEKIGSNVGSRHTKHKICLRGPQKIDNTYQKHIPNWLAVLTILKNDGVRQWEGLSYIMENKQCLKSPTNYILGYRPFTKADPLVSWDDDIPNIWKNNPNVWSHQPANISKFPKLYTSHYHSRDTLRLSPQGDEKKDHQEKQTGDLIGRWVSENGTCTRPGKRLHFANWKDPPLSMGKSTISTGPFS